MTAPAVHGETVHEGERRKENAQTGLPSANKARNKILYHLSFAVWMIASIGCLDCPLPEKNVNCYIIKKYVCIPKDILTFSRWVTNM